ncbi:unnamed protein product, partial [Rangifer tarandus platyrhynchus]
MTCSLGDGSQNHSPAENRREPPGLLLYGLDLPAQEVLQEDGQGESSKKGPLMGDLESFGEEGHQCSRTAGLFLEGQRRTETDSRDANRGLQLRLCCFNAAQLWSDH